MFLSLKLNHVKLGLDAHTQLKIGYAYYNPQNPNDPMKNFKLSTIIFVGLLQMVHYSHAQQLPNLTYLTFDDKSNRPPNVRFGSFEMLYKSDTNTFVHLGYNRDSYGYNIQHAEVDFSPNIYVVDLPYSGMGYFILKTDSNYVPISHKLLLCTTAATNEVRVENIRTDKDRNLYVSGAFSGTIDFYPGDSTYNRTSIYPKFGSNPLDYFIAKYDTALNLIWVKTYKPVGNTGGVIECIDFEVARDGSAIYFTPILQGGGFWLNATQRIYSTITYPFVLIKLDANGDLAWFKTQSSNPAYPITTGYRFRLNSQNEIIMAGYFGGTVDLDWGAGQYLIYKTAPNNPQVGAINAFLAKYDADGVFLDALVINAPTYSSFYNFFKVGKNDDIVVIADTYDYFAPNPLNPSYQIPNMTNRIGYACYDKNLNFLWAGSVPDSNYITNLNPETYPPILQDARSGAYYLISKQLSSPSGMPIITKVDSNGVLVYQFKLPMSIIWSPTIHNGSLITTGHTDSVACDFNPLAGVVSVPRASTFVIKYSDYVVNGVSTHAPLVGGTSIYPTPATHELVVERSAGSPPAVATLYDLWGRVVLATTLTQPRSQLGVGELPSGFYVLRIAGEGRSYKVVVQH